MTRRIINGMTIMLLTLLILGLTVGAASAAVNVNNVGATVTAGLGSQDATTGNLTIVFTSGPSDIGNSTNINITIPQSSGVTFDDDENLIITSVGAITVGTYSYSNDANNSIITIPVTTISGPSGLSIAGIEVNVSADAAVGPSTLTVATTNATSVTSYDTTNSITVAKPTIGGAGDILYVDMDGQSSLSLSDLTIASTVANDIGDGSSINITIEDSNVTFDSDDVPAVTSSDSGITAVSITKFSANEIGISVTGDSAGDGTITVSGLEVNLSEGTPTTTDVDFDVRTTPAGGLLVLQDYDALSIILEMPNAVTIVHSPGNIAANSATVGTNVELTAHASSANIPDYGGYLINFSVLTAPAPLTWTINGFNSSFDNSDVVQFEQMETESNGNATLNLKLSTRASDDDSGITTDVKATLNNTSVSATLGNGGNDITTVDDVETHINVTSDFNSVRAVSTESILFTAQLRDQFDNFVENGENKSSGFGLGFGPTSANSASIPDHFINGTESVSVYDTTQESVTVSFDSVVVGIDTGSKTVSYVSAAYGISLTSDKSSVPADGSSIIRVYAQLLDASGNPLALHKDSNLWTYSQSNLVFGTDGTFAQVNESGINYVDLTSAEASGTTVVTVRYTNALGVVVWDSITLTTTQSIDADNSVASASASSIKADDKVTFTATVNDENDQPIENAAVTFKLEAGNGTLTNAYNALENVTGLNQTITVMSNSAGGVAVEFYNRNSSETNSVNITVVYKGVVTALGAAPYSVTVAPANASTIILTPASQGIKNVNETLANIAISLKDAYGNVVTDPLVLNVTNLNPALGYLSTDETAGQITLNASGQGTVVFEVESEIQDSATIDFAALASYNSAYLTTDLTGFTALVTTSGPSDVVVSFNVTSPVVGDVVQVSAQLTDADGNPLGIPDKMLTFTVFKEGTSVAFYVETAITDANGIATFDLDEVTELGTYTVTASNATLALSNSSSITFAGDVASIVAKANNTEGTYSTPVGSTVTISATAMDAGGNVAIGTTSDDVIFLIGANSIGQDSFTDGIASINYTSSVAGTYTIMAYVNTTLYDTVNVTFTAGGLAQTGDINGNGAVQLSDAIYLAKHVAGTSGYETLFADGDINGNGAVQLSDAIYLAKHVAGTSGYETLY